MESNHNKKKSLAMEYVENFHRVTAGRRRLALPCSDHIFPPISFTYLMTESITEIDFQATIIT